LLVGAVGELVGCVVGDTVGDIVGLLVGFTVGDIVGFELGLNVGENVGELEGAFVGIVGEVVGMLVLLYFLALDIHLFCSELQAQLFLLLHLLRFSNLLHFLSILKNSEVGALVGLVVSGALIL